MPHYLPAVAYQAPIADPLLDRLIAAWRRGVDITMSDADAELMLAATTGCLEELANYRRLLGRAYADAWIEGAIEASPNIVRLARPANRTWPEGAA